MKRLICCAIAFLIIANFILVVSAANGPSIVTFEMYQEYIKHKAILDKYIKEGKILPPIEKQSISIDYIKQGERMPRFLAHDDITGQDIPNPNYPQVGDAAQYWTRKNITKLEMYANDEMMKRIGIKNTFAHKEYWSSSEGKRIQDMIIDEFIETKEGKEYKKAIEAGEQATGKQYRNIRDWLDKYALFGIAGSKGYELFHSITIGRDERWYKTYAMSKIEELGTEYASIIGYEPNTVTNISGNNITERTTFWAFSIPVSSENKDKTRSIKTDAYGIEFSVPGNMYPVIKRDTLPKLREFIEIQIDYYELKKNSRKLLQSKKVKLSPEQPTNYIDYTHPLSTSGDTQYQAIFKVVSKHVREPKLDWYGERMTLYEEYHYRTTYLADRHDVLFSNDNTGLNDAIKKSGDARWYNISPHFPFYFYMKNTWDLYSNHIKWNWKKEWFEQGFVQAISFISDKKLAILSLQERPSSIKENFNYCDIYDVQFQYPRNKNNYDPKDFMIFTQYRIYNKMDKRKEAINKYYEDNVWEYREKEFEWNPDINLVYGLSQDKASKFIYDRLFEFDYLQVAAGWPSAIEYLKKNGVKSLYLNLK